jgi:Uma2 family endonuclease
LDAVITRTFALGPEFDTLPNDTEETLVGSSLHQAAIVALYTSLQQCGPRRGLPWFVGNQIKLIIPREGGGSYQPAPDILVHPTLSSGSRESLYVKADGPPVLIIEVASPPTAAERDTNLTSPAGKPSVYASIGVREYLVFDPSDDILGSPVWARRQGLDGFVPWAPDGMGRWFSPSLGISFEPQGTLLRVYDQNDQLVRLTDEFADLTIEQAENIRELQRQMAAQEQRLAELEAEIRRLRGG